MPSVAIQELGVTLSFPDGTPDDVIDMAIQDQIDAVTPKEGVLKRAGVYTGGLAEDVAKSIVQGAVGDNLRFMIGTQQRRDIEQEVYNPREPMKLTTRDRFHMSEWSTTQQEAGRPITSEEWKQELVRFKETERTASVNRMRGVIERLPEPREREDFFGKAMVGATRFMGSMGISAVSPTAGTIMVFTQIAGMSYDQYRKAGVEQDRAWDAAMINALLQTPIEQAGNLLQIGFLKHLGSKFVKEGAKSVKRAVDFVEMLIKNAAAEGTEEFLQTYPEEIANRYAANPDKNAVEIVGEVMGSLQSIAKIAKEKGLPAAALGAAGGAGLGGLVGTIQAPFTLGAYIDERDYQKRLGKIKKDLPEFARGLAAAVEGGLVNKDDVEEIKKNLKDRLPDEVERIDQVFEPVDDVLATILEGPTPEEAKEEVAPIPEKKPKPKITPKDQWLLDIAPSLTKEEYYEQAKKYWDEEDPTLPEYDERLEVRDRLQKILGEKPQADVIKEKLEEAEEKGKEVKEGVPPIEVVPVQKPGAEKIEEQIKEAEKGPTIEELIEQKVPMEHQIAQAEKDKYSGLYFDLFPGSAPIEVISPDLRNRIIKGNPWLKKLMEPGFEDINTVAAAMWTSEAAKLQAPEERERHLAQIRRAEGVRKKALEALLAFSDEVFGPKPKEGAPPEVTPEVTPEVKEEKPPKPAKKPKAKAPPKPKAPPKTGEARRKYFNRVRAQTKKAPVANLSDEEANLIGRIESDEGYGIEVPLEKRERLLSFIETGNFGTPIEVVNKSKEALGTNVYKFERPYGTVFYEEESGMLYIEPPGMAKSVVAGREETVGMGVDIDRTIDVISRNTIGSYPSETIINELMQNSVDAFLATQKERNLDIKLDRRNIQKTEKGEKEEDYDTLADVRRAHILFFKDNAKGMSAEEVKKYFLTVGAMGKSGTTSAGGYGFAKTAFMLWPRRIQVTTRRRLKNGNIEQSSFDTTPDEIRVGKAILKVEELDTPGLETGTEFEFVLPNDASHDELYSRIVYYAQNIRKSPPFKIHLNDKGTMTETEYTTKIFAQEKHKFKKERVVVDDENVIDVYFIAASQAYTERGDFYIQIKTYNKGLMTYIRTADWNMPRLNYDPGFHVAVDFVRTAKPGTAKYPFLDNRQSVNWQVVSAVRDVVVNRAKQKDQERLQQEIADMRRMINEAPVVEGVRVLIPFKDKEEIKKARAIVQKNKKVFRDFARIYKFFNQKLTDLREKEIELCFTVDPNLHGCRTDESVAGFALYAINPFSVTDFLLSLPGYQNLIDAGQDATGLKASNFVETLVHEYAHNRVHHHGAAFTGEHGRLVMAMGFRYLGRLAHETYTVFESNEGRIRDVQANLADLGKSGSRFLGADESEVPGEELSPTISAVVRAGEKGAGGVRITRGTVPGRVGNKYIEMMDGTIYETHESLHARILEAFPELNPEDIKEKGIITKGGQKIALDIIDPFSMSNKEQQNLRDLAKAVMDRLRQTVGQKEVLDKMEILVTPIIEVDINEARASVMEHAKAGRKLEEGYMIAGATDFVSFSHSLVQLSAYLPDFKALAKEAYHEYFENCWVRVMPDNDRKYIMDFYGSKEDGANAFATFANDERDLSAKAPGPVIRIFRRFKRFLQMMKNWLDRKGFKRPEDIWGKLITGQYKELPKAKFEARVKGKEKAVTSVREITPEELGQKLMLRDLKLQTDVIPTVQIHRLRDLIEYPELFIVYPGLADMRVELTYHKQFGRPHGYSVGGHISISAGTEIDLRRGLAHEIQHQIDVLEKRPLGEERAERAGRTVASVREVAPEPGPGIKHRLLDPEKEAVFQAAQDYTGPTFWEKAKDLLTRAKNKATREFEYLPKTGYYAELRNTLLVLAKQKGVQAPKALQEIEEITKGLNDVDYHNFVRYVAFKDFQEEAKLQKERGGPILLPEGLTAEEVDTELSRIEATMTPEIRKSLAMRRKKWNELRIKYIEAFKRIGVKMEEKLKREHYFRHIVMDYVKEAGIFGTGQRLKTPVYRSHLRQRKGTEKMIYMNYVAAEHEVMAQMLYDIQVANAIHDIDANYNEIDNFKRSATQINYANVIKALQAYADAMEVPPTQERPTGEDLYRRLGTKMAIGFDNLGRLAAADELPPGPDFKYADLLTALADNWETNAELKAEAGREWTADQRVPLREPYAGQLLGYANYVLKAKEEATGKAKGAAATIFKGIAERRQAVKDILGHQYVTWQKLVREDKNFTDWQPQQGNIFFNVYTIPEQTALGLLEGKLSEANIDESMIKRMLAMGPKRRPLVVTNEIHDTLNSITPTKNEAWAWHRKTLKAWKVWQLVMPRRFFKYNFRNLSGDADAVFAGNPSTIKKVKQATTELVHLMMLRSPAYNRLPENTRNRLEAIFGKPELTEELNEWVERGGYGTLLQAQEIDEYSAVLNFGEELLRKEGAKSFKDVTVRGYKAYWKAVRRLTDTREAILRYAAYLDYLEQMKADPNGLPKNYGGSIPEEIKGLHNIRDRAFWLSNELLGAYDRVSVVGQTVREHMIPFWSWQEVNFVRYKRLLMNAIRDHGAMEGIGRRMAGTAVRSPYLAYRLGAFTVQALALWSMLHLWNLWIMGDNDEDLPEEVRNRPHLTLWRDEDGEVQYFSRLGAVGDLLDWVALDTAVADIQDLFSGRKTLKEKVKEMAGAPVNKVIQGGQPFLKVGAELLSRQALFPDVFNPRPIRDRMLHLTRSLGLENEYIALMDTFIKPMPSEGYWRSWKTAFWYERDPFESAYYDFFNRKRDFLKKAGKLSTGFWLNPSANALYNARTALRYGDDEAMLYYMNRYFELGGTKEGLERSVANMHPLAGLNKTQQVALVAELTPDELDKLVRALVFYVQLRTGIHSKEIWEMTKAVPERAKTPMEAIGKLGEIARITKQKGGK